MRCRCSSLPITRPWRSAPMSISRAISPSPSRWNNAEQGRAAPLCEAAVSRYRGGGNRPLPDLLMTNIDQSGASPVAPKSSAGPVSRLRNYFLTGLVVAGPVAVTLWIIWWFVTWVDNLVRPVIPVMYRPETYLPYNVPGFGLIIALFALTMLGFLTANLVGSR